MLWYVAFMDERDTVGPAWWRDAKYRGLFTKPGVEHCIAYRSVSPGSLLFVEPMAEYLHVDVVDGWAHDMNRELAADLGATILLYRHEEAPPPQRRRVRAQHVTCASVLGYMLGVEPVPLGPLQLLEALRQRGAKEIT